MTNGSSTAPVVAISGAGSGLGAAMAKTFAAAGYRVVVTDQHEDRARQVADGLDGEGHWACAMDVTDSAQWARLDDEIVTARHQGRNLLI